MVLVEKVIETYKTVKCELYRSVSMTTEEIITAIFIEVDDNLPPIKKHKQATLYPSELVTIGILFALKGVGFRAFYRWLKRDYEPLFRVYLNEHACNAYSKHITIGVNSYWHSRVFHCDRHVSY